MTASNPLTRQVAGSHYVKLGMQPVVFATANRYDPCAFSILKYVTRWRDKNGIQDLQKALHFAELRMTPEIASNLPKRWGDKYGTPPLDYIEANRMADKDGAVIVWLHYWVYSNAGDVRGPDYVVSLLQQLISENGG